MLELIIIGLFLTAVGVPIAKSLGFMFNPFWAFTNYKRIKNDDSRISDFYNSTQSKISNEVTTSVHLTEIPKPIQKFEIIK